jgi:hypothetical protein
LLCPAIQGVYSCYKTRGYKVLSSNFVESKVSFYSMSQIQSYIRNRWIDLVYETIQNFNWGMEWWHKKRTKKFIITTARLHKKQIIQFYLIRIQGKFYALVARIKM